MIKPKVVLLIFVSGKIVLTGAKVREEIYMAFNQIYSVLVGEYQPERVSGRVLTCYRVPQGVIDALDVTFRPQPPPSSSLLYTPT